jgi:hypothetical protein
MEYDLRVIIQFLFKKASSPTPFSDELWHSLGKTLTIRGVSGGGASLFGKDAKADTTRYHLAGRQSTSLTSEFWPCSVKSRFKQLIRLLIPREFPTQLD